MINMVRRMYKILLVEDDLQIVNHLTQYLQNENYLVMYTDCQNSAMNLIENNDFDLVLLDISLKQGNGFVLYNEIKSYKNIPIVFLSANNDEFSIITGLNLGADDYIEKPFKPRILLSRIQNILKRYHQQDTLFQLRHLKVNTLTGKVYKDNHEIYLSALEYKLLLIFFSYPHQLLTRDFLLDEIWNITGEDVSDNTLTVYMKRLRQKIEDDPQNPTFILTVRGLGYRLGS